MRKITKKQFEKLEKKKDKTEKDYRLIFQYLFNEEWNPNLVKSIEKE